MSANEYVLLLTQRMSLEFGYLHCGQGQIHIHISKIMWPYVARTTSERSDPSMHPWMHPHLYLELSTYDWITHDSC